MEMNSEHVPSDLHLNLILTRSNNIFIFLWPSLAIGSLIIDPKITIKRNCRAYASAYAGKVNNFEYEIRWDAASGHDIIIMLTDSMNDIM